MLKNILTDRNFRALTACNLNKNLGVKCLQVDILILEVERAGLITVNMIKQEAVVIDGGMNRNFYNKFKVSKITRAIIPVPRGGELMTILELLKNAVGSAKNFINK